MSSSLAGVFVLLSLCAVSVLPSCAQKKAAQQPVYAPDYTTEAPLLELAKPFLEMSREQLLALVPPQGGFIMSDCPNCEQGDQENQLAWRLELGDKVQCKYCKAVLPSAKYPENGQVEIEKPGGGTQVFRFYQDKDGHKYWFQARRWYDQRETMENAAYTLAQLYLLDKDKYAEAGQRAALILQRFAEVYPGYIVHYEYPGQEKQFFPADADLVETTRAIPDGPYRASRWTYWAYLDISIPLLKTYDILRASDLLSAKDRQRIETDLLGAMLDFTARYDPFYDTLPANNMHPYLWQSQAMAARILHRPQLDEEIIAHLRRLLEQQFSYDGMWKEGTVSYHQQTVNGLRRVLERMRPDLSGAALDEWLAATYPDLAQALTMERVFRLPNKRYAAINDTWARPEYSGAPPQVSTPHLLGGMGYAILGMGRDEKQLQAHLKFSGRFGHEHYDSLNLLLFGAGRELVSDLGYTHTIARPWTMTTAAHNTVLVDGENQSAGAGAARALGNVLLFNADDPDFQVVQANAPGAYAKATTYQRALIAVRAPDGTQYVADVFDVAGGAQHDWILHGSADDEQSLELQNAQTHEPLSMQPQASLLPADFSFTPLTKQGQYALIRQGAWALGNFRDAQSATSGQSVQATFRFKSDAQRGLRTWIIGAPDTTYATARAWSVRGTGMPNHENDAKLNDHLRAALIVRRPGASHRFVAVHHPFSGELKVKSVESIAMQPDGVALKIERAGGTDYLLWGGDEKPRSGRLDDIPFSFDGRVALIHRDGDQTVLKMMGGTRLQCGDKVLAGKPAAPATLLGVEGNRLRVAGALPAKPGAVVLVAHGDGSRNAFHVAKAEYSQGETIITTQERAALSGEAAGEMTLLTFPHLKYPAPHRVEMTVLSSSAG